jgi:glycosyltransferase involved in cell wall biosynthesis
MHMPGKRLPVVAVVYPVPFGDHGVVGGGERFAIELARSLSRTTATRFITFGERASVRSDSGLDIRTRRVFLFARGLKNNPISATFLADLRDVDVIHCVVWHTLVTDLCVLFAKITGKRVFVTDVGGGGSISMASKAPLARAVDGFMPLSQFAAGFTPRGGTNVETIFGGADLSTFQPGRWPREPKVVFVGRLLPHKGVDYLIEAVPENVLLRVIGRPYDPAYLDKLRKLATGKRVEFLSEAGDSQMVEELQTATVTAMPSVYNTRDGAKTSVPELFGLAAAEAMACATPVIATAVGSLPEVVQDSTTGWIVPPNDVGALRAALQTALHDPATASVFGAAGRRRVEELFTWEAVARRCLKGYAAAKYRQRTA